MDESSKHNQIILFNLKSDIMKPSKFLPLLILAALAQTASAADQVNGEKIYTTACLACHDAGVLGAPKFADKAAWKPRIAKGKAVLYTSALNGINLMPAKGGNATLKDEDVKAAVDYMIGKAS